MKTTESPVQRACIDYLHIRGHKPIRVNNGAVKIGKRYIRFTDTPGVADIIGSTSKGRALAVETKGSNGKQSEEQKIFESDWIARGGLYVLARGIDDLKEAGL